MSDHERGAYTPPTADAPLSFDPRQPVRGARPIPFTLILSVLVLAALVAAIFVFYQQGVREAGQPPQVVGDPVAGMKETAPVAAQPTDPAAGLQIYQDDAGAPMETVGAPPTFTPPPEQPQPRPVPPVVVTQAPPAQPTPKTAAPPTATAQALKPVIPAAAPKTAPQNAPAPAPKAAAPAPKPAPPPPEKKPATPEPKAVASGGARVQVGAVGSTALADRAWSDAVGAAPGLAAGKGKAVEKIEGGNLYRTFVTGFATKADAQAFCARLQSAGKSCFVR